MKTDHKEWDKKVKTELNLTADQVTKYDAIVLEYSGKMDALVKDANLTKEAKKNKPDFLSFLHLSNKQSIQRWWIKRKPQNQKNSKTGSYVKYRAGHWTGFLFMYKLFA